MSSQSSVELIQSNLLLSDVTKEVAEQNHQPQKNEKEINKSYKVSKLTVSDC